MLKRCFVFILINLVFSVNIAFTSDIKSKIKNISLTGLFENSDRDPYIITDYSLPVDRIAHKVEFTYGNTTYIIPFLATVIKTTSDNENKYICDEVKIEYFSTALTKFYQNYAILKFKAYDEKGNIMPIYKIISYRAADSESSGWILKNDVFPAEEVMFITKDYGQDKGVTDGAWFIIQYLHSVSEP